MARARTDGTGHPIRRRARRWAVGLVALGVAALTAACGSSTPLHAPAHTTGTPLPGASTAGIPLTPVTVPGAPTPGSADPPATGWDGLLQQRCATRAADTTVLSVTHATAFDDTWTSYGNTGQGWTGGDSVHAYALGPSTVVWGFADTFLGPLGPHGTRSPSAQLYHNVFVVQHGDQFQTLVGGIPGHLGSLVITSDPYQIFLTLAGLQTATTLQEFLLEDVIPPHTTLREDPAGTLLVTYALPSLRRLSVVRLTQETASIEWGAAVTRWGAYTYIYGSSAFGSDKRLYVARVRGTDLARSWQYWDGHGWNPKASAAVGVDRGVSAEVSVTDVDGMAVLVTTPTTTPYSSFVDVETGCSPIGPFHQVAQFRATYSTGPLGLAKYGVSDSYVYDAQDQPAFNRGSTWLISIDRNVLRYSDLAKSVAAYRPSYFWVRLGPRSALGSS